jgi:phosphatidylserine decarboxylase
MKQRMEFYRFLSLNVWGNLPSPLQRGISRTYTSIYNKKFSRHFIRPYCKLNYDDPDYLEKFLPASGKDQYQSFQDFFTRTFREPLKIKERPVWGSEGLLCESGRVSEFDLVNVKGDKRHLRSIFGRSGKNIPDDYYFHNIFLHNNNYHRIHSPVDGEIVDIERIKGDLVLLRPWVYQTDPSHPALRNERVNVVIKDVEGLHWYFFIVGSGAVVKIKHDR